MPNTKPWIAPPFVDPMAAPAMPAAPAPGPMQPGMPSTGQPTIYPPGASQYVVGPQGLMGGGSPYGPSIPQIDFSKIDPKTPGGQKQMLQALQGMYRAQQEWAKWPQQQEDPREAYALGQPGVNGIVNTWDPMQGGGGR